MKTIAVYGSLKKGKYNHSFLSDMRMIGTTTVRGTLYKVSSYPALVDEGETEYDAEVYEVDDYIYDMINRMELGAGYKEVLQTLWIEQEGVLESQKEVGVCECAECNGDCGKTCVVAIVYYADTRLAEYCKENYEVIESY